MIRTVALALLLVACGSDDVAPIDASTPSGYAAFAMPELGGERYGIRSDVVEDLVTGLIWQRGDTGALRTLEEARAECAALELEGREDFRLPTRVEWVSIVAPARSPTIDGSAFPDALAEYHWTTSEPDEAPGSAFSVYLGAGETTLGLASRPSARVRCVAGGPAPIEGAQHEVRGDGVHDRGTGLTWSRAMIDATTWSEARDACIAIGARLPTIRELQTIVDESRRAPAIDPALFPDTPSERHWTSTIRDAGDAQPWTVDFLDGQTYADELGDVPHVARCVLGPPP
ncbi:DUF1566 domain-containing protein [Sandaracinus amylolyticus]|uniref:Lcl C-terminal domain-containing protein n=1 Tax=Sandaracinus amylolyticus TaxID=927083 RepID=UPI001F2D6709|nr:DUF1566 domain-containing protein [Sandaracinus amylolyticus]UJR82465.1 Hypothetical protein I5071_45300 [Sandaracinus amylolyticus]